VSVDVVYCIVTTEEDHRSVVEMYWERVAKRLAACASVCLAPPTPVEVRG